MIRKWPFSIGVIALGLLLVLSTPVLAQFDGDYAIANWSETRIGDPPAGGGEVDVSGAPASIVLQGGDDGCDGGFQGPGPQASGRVRGDGGPLPEFSCLLLFVVDITGTGTLSFRWDYETDDEDGPEFDLFGYLLNGVPTQLSVDEGDDIQSGTASLNVSDGDEFGFFIDCTDCEGGPASVTISQFSAPSGAAPPPAAVSVPVNSPFALILLTLLLTGLGLIAIRVGR